MASFGPTPRHDDEALDEHDIGADAVRTHYADLFRAAPDLSIDVQTQYVAGDAVVLECRIRGTHLGPWRGLPATGNRIDFPLCAVFTLVEGDAVALAGERIYYDLATVLRQLGVLHDPDSLRGRVVMTLTHPDTLWRIVRHRLPLAARPAASGCSCSTTGSAGSRRAWDGVWLNLVASCNVVALDLPPGKLAGPTVLADAVEPVLDRLGWDRPNVTGHSLGCWVALELATGERARSVVALAPVGFWTGPEQAWVRHLADRQRGK